MNRPPPLDRRLHRLLQPEGAMGQPGHLEYFADTITMFNNPQNESPRPSATSLEGSAGSFPARSVMICAAGEANGKARRKAGFRSPADIQREYCRVLSFSQRPASELEYFVGLGGDGLGPLRSIDGRTAGKTRYMETSPHDEYSVINFLLTCEYGRMVAARSSKGA